MPEATQTQPAGRRAPRLVLASASPRRRRILEDLGLRFEVIVPLVEESDCPLAPRRTAEENARAKNLWGRARRPDGYIVAADTIVVLDGRCLGKPRGPDEARAFLRALSGRAHEVITGTAFSAPGGGPEVAATVSVVRFRPLDDAVIEEYIRLVGPLDRAGAYDIDRHPELIVDSCEGSRTNVMGLPRELVRRWVAGHPELRA